MIEELKGIARELFRSKRVQVLLGYRRAPDGVSAMPYFVFGEEGVDAMIWDFHCVYNLANYIKDFPGKSIAIVAKSCDVKAITVLIQENQVKREDLVIIGVECRGMIDEKRSSSKDMAFDEKCRHCARSIPAVRDHLVKEKGEAEKKFEGPGEYDSVRKMEAKSLEERFRFWEREFSRCIRCYACRQVCPMCYCPKCVADQASPAWFSKASSFEGNFSWNLTRAIHLAGRCISCGECERACPVGIPLMELNKKIEKDVKELFKYEAGADAGQKPLFTSFDKSDPEGFIR